MNPIFGATRHVPGPIAAPAKPAHSAMPDLPTQRIRYRFGWPAADTEAVSPERFDQFGDGRRPMDGEVHCKHVP
jgi:hypothetical protein